MNYYLIRLCCLDVFCKSHLPSSIPYCLGFVILSLLISSDHLVFSFLVPLFVLLSHLSSFLLSCHIFSSSLHFRLLIWFHLNYSLLDVSSFSLSHWFGWMDSLCFGSCGFPLCVFLKVVVQERAPDVCLFVFVVLIKPACCLLADIFHKISQRSVRFFCSA